MRYRHFNNNFIFRKIGGNNIGMKNYFLLLSFYFNIFFYCCYFLYFFTTKITQNNIMSECNWNNILMIYSYVDFFVYLFGTWGLFCLSNIFHIYIVFHCTILLLLFFIYITKNEIICKWVIKNEFMFEFKNKKKTRVFYEFV